MAQEAMKRCAVCKSYDLRFDEGLGMDRCMSCWAMQVPKEDNRGRD